MEQLVFKHLVTFVIILGVGSPVVTAVLTNCGGLLCGRGSLCDEATMSCVCRTAYGQGFNLSGIYRCTKNACPPGWTLSADKMHCENRTCPSGWTLSADGELCQNRTCPSGWTLSADGELCQRTTCPSGWTLSADGKHCEKTTCLSGWTLSADGKHCEIKSCESWLPWLADDCGARSCPSGWTLSADKKFCEKTETIYIPNVVGIAVGVIAFLGCGGACCGVYRRKTKANNNQITHVTPRTAQCGREIELQTQSTVSTSWVPGSGSQQAKTVHM